jgi:hypothetical protein
LLGHGRTALQQNAEPDGTKIELSGRALNVCAKVKNFGSFARPRPINGLAVAKDSVETRLHAALTSVRRLYQPKTVILLEARVFS